MNWLQISINTSKDNAERAEDCLFAAGAQTVTLTDAADQPILEPGVNEVPIWNAVVVTGLFSNDQHEDKDSQKELLEHIEASLPDIEHSCDIEVLEDRNWTRAWMDNYDAMQFGQRLWVVPMHIEPPEPGAVNLRLDPGLAFGTGTHPTTSLCLRWLDANIKQQETLLDFGCGSGILAIAACMLGVEKAHGVDIDPQALIATHDNARSNHVADKIRTWLPEDYDKDYADTQYDIVVANILSGPLTELSPTLAHHTKTGGDIVLSGILREQADTVLSAYSEFFDMDNPVFDEDWVMLHGKKIR